MRHSLKRFRYEKFKKPLPILVKTCHVLNGIGFFAFFASHPVSAQRKLLYRIAKSHLIFFLSTDRLPFFGDGSNPGQCDDKVNQISTQVLKLS